MYLLYHSTTRRIHAASNVTPQAPDGFAVVEVAGDADTYEFPLGDAPRCLYTEAGEIMADPDNPIVQADTLIEGIKAEAERRIDAGLLIGGNVFRCDEKSVGRITGLAQHAQRLEDASQSVSIAFKTDAGVDISITSAAQAWAIFDAVSAYLAAVLAASAVLQDDPPVDYTDDSHWP